MNKVANFLFISFLLCAAGCQKGAFIPDYNPNDSLKQQLSDIYQNGQLPGFSVALVQVDTLLFEQSFGYADLASKTPLSSTTPQNIASISKTFIGIALMQAVEVGQLNLDQPINEILPFNIQNPNHPTIPITVRHLATHTASIEDQGIEYHRVYLDAPLTLMKEDINKETYQFFTEWSKNEAMPLGNFLEATLLPEGIYYEKNRFLKSAPGSQYQYSNLGASLLAYTIGLAMKQPFENYVKTQILQPLEMYQTQWSFDENLNTQRATTYFQNQHPVPSYQNILYPAGGLFSTAADLTLYLMHLLKNHQGADNLLTAAAFQEMIQPQLIAEQSPPSETKNQGLMWELNGQQAGHNGGNYGVTLFMAFDKEKNYGRLFMTNISSYEDQKLIPQMVEIWKLLGKEGDRLSQ